MDVGGHRGDVESIEDSADSVETLGVLVMEYADSDSVTEAKADGTMVVMHEHGESDDERNGPLVYQTNGRLDSLILNNMDSEQHLRSILVQGKLGLVSTNIDYLELKYVCCK